MKINIFYPKTNERITPNPNVMIELGYAAKALGWSNILCIYNVEFGKIEELPFDIRQRKPITYNTTKEKAYKKQNLTKFISESFPKSSRDNIQQNKIAKRRCLTKKAAPFLFFRERS